MPADALDQVERITAHLLTSHQAFCECCGRDIHTGHTVYLLDRGNARHYLACWECGQAIMQHLGFAVAAEYPTAPPYGGGVNQARRSSRNSRPTAPARPFD